MDQNSIMVHSNTKRCAYVVMWLMCILLYTLQYIFGIWLAVLEFISMKYTVFGVIITCLTIPTLILCVISLVWYRDQDNVNRSLQQTLSNDRNVTKYITLLGFGTVVTHITGFGVLHR